VTHPLGKKDVGLVTLLEYNRLMGKNGALAYGRQSMGNDRSIAEQLESGRKRAATENWDILAEYSDRISASRYATKARDDWAKLLTALARPEATRLWLWETSRGDRKLSTWAAMLERCREHKVQVYVETHGRLYDMSNGRDMRTLCEDGVDNAYESDKISDRTVRAMQANAGAGIPQSRAPYGYRHLHDDRGNFTERVKDQAEAANVEDLFGQIRQGHSLRAIERDWDQRGIRTRTGKRFSAQHLRDMAMNPAYAALRVHLTTEDRKAQNGRSRLDTATEGDWPPIILREEFYAVREILTSPARKTSRPGRAVHLLSVSPAARCGVCDGPLAAEHRPMGADRERRWMYFCQKSGHVRISEADLDQLATDAILGYLSRPDVYTAFDTTDGPELAKVRGELAGLRSQRRELADAVTKRGKSVTWALAADDDYERQIITLETRERELTTPDVLRGLMAPGPDVDDRWASAPMSTRREVARLVLAADRLGTMKVQRGARLLSEQRVTWLRGN
jgi:site-specific DNA recombinase